MMYGPTYSNRSEGKGGGEGREEKQRTLVSLATAGEEGGIGLRDMTSCSVSFFFFVSVFFVRVLCAGANEISIWFFLVLGVLFVFVESVQIRITRAFHSLFYPLIWGKEIFLCKKQNASGGWCPSISFLSSPSDQKKN